MKVLHVTDAASGGVLASMTALARSQAADPRFEWVSVRYTPRSDSPTCDAIAVAMGSGVDVEEWSSNHRRSPLGRLVLGMLSELRRDWDIVHLHSSRAGFLGRMCAAVLSPRAHLVYSPHGFAFNQLAFSASARNLFRRFEQAALCGGRDLVLVSRGEAELAVDHLPRARTAVLSNAIDTDDFRPAGHSAGTDTDPINVVHIGRITGQKRPELFAQIAARADIDHPGRFRFLWIGDGDRKRLRGGPEITITGWLEPEAIREQLSGVSLLLFTSTGEGMPMSLLEAASMGIPAIGSDVVGVRDLIDHGRDGMLFDTVAEAVAALNELANADVRRELGEAARARIVSDHSQADLAERSLQIYCSFLAPDPGTDQERSNGSDSRAPGVSIDSNSSSSIGEKPAGTHSAASTGRRSA